MTVTLFVNTAVNPATQVADVLEGAGTGIDFANVTVGSYSNSIDQTANTGAKQLYAAHDGVNEISDLKTYIDTFSQTYGGAVSASNDFNLTKAFGNASGSSKNNIDGNSAGLWIDMNHDVIDTNQFDIILFPSDVKIYGDSNTDGIDFLSGIDFASTAMVQDDGSTSGTVPETGKIGPSGNTVLGSNAKFKLRYYFPTSPPSGFPSLDSGILQCDLVFSFSSTT